MSNDLSVPPVAAAVAPTESAGQTRVAADTAAVEPRQAAASSVGPNPSLQLDPALGLVVIEFRNEAGVVTTSIPSQSQLLAYQRWATTQFGPAPSGMPPGNAETTPHHHVPAATPAPVKEPPVSAPRPAALPRR
jgi:hypothetical protein